MFLNRAKSSLIKGSLYLNRSKNVSDSILFTNYKLNSTCYSHGWFTYTQKCLFSQNHILEKGKRKKDHSSNTKSSSANSDFSNVKSDFDIEKFKSQLDSVIKSYKSTIHKLLDETYELKSSLEKMKIELPVESGHGNSKGSHYKVEEVNLRDVSNINNRGSNSIIITVYDADKVKRISSGIVKQRQNLSPIVDPQNPQVLTIKLPRASDHKKKELFIKLKDLYNQFDSQGSRDSLSAIRKVNMKILKTLLSKNSSISESESKKLSESIENAHKKARDTLKAAYEEVNRNLEKKS